MKSSSYPGALSVAAPVAAHLERHATAARAAGRDDLAQLPGTRAVETLVDVAFWASFRREEGRPPRISLAWLPPDDAGLPLQMASRLPLTPEVLAHLSPAVERPGIHLGVWGGEEGLYLWGMTRRIPPLCLVVEVVQPGLLVVKRRRLNTLGKYANVAVLEGSLVKVVDEEAIRASDCPPLLASLMGFTSSAGANGGTDVLMRLAISMRAHRHGGTLLVAPASSTSWRGSVVWPVQYLVDPVFAGLSTVLRTPPSEESRGGTLEAYANAVESVAGLTAVDGATIVTDRFEVLAFGAKIGRARGKRPIERLMLMEPVQGNRPVVVDPSILGGTRHLSSAQFVHDQRDALALVASQDGQFTILSWSERDRMVHARLVETLLL